MAVTTAGVSNIAADGTVVGTAWPDGTVVRWVPGHDPEILGGGLTYTLENIMPLIAKDGGVIATTGYFATGAGDAERASPEIWQGATDWQEVSGLVLGDASPCGISYDGQTLVGGASPPAGAPPDSRIKRRGSGRRAAASKRSACSRAPTGAKRGPCRTTVRSPPASSRTAASRGVARAGSMACRNGFSTRTAPTSARRSDATATVRSSSVPASIRARRKRGAGPPPAASNISARSAMGRTARSTTRSIRTKTAR